MNTPRQVTELAARASLRVDSGELLISGAVTQVPGPPAVFEMLYIRVTQRKGLAMRRPDMIAVLGASSG